MSPGLGCGVHLNFGAERAGQHGSVAVGVVAYDLAGELFAPLLDLVCLSIDPVEVRLEIAVGTGDVADFYGEEDVAAVAGPADMAFEGLVVGDAAGRG